MSNSDSGFKKFFKQVGNAIAIHAVSAAAIEAGQVVWPAFRDKVKGAFNKANDFVKVKDTNKSLRDLTRNTKAHYSETATSVPEVQKLPEPPADDADPPVTPTFRD